MSETRDDRQLRVLVVEGDRRVRRGLTGMLEAAGEMEVVAVAATALEALDAVCDARPDIVLIDLDRPDADAWLDVIAALHATSCGCAIAAMSEAGTLRSRCLEAGADAFIHKWSAPDDMYREIRALQPHEPERGSKDAPPMDVVAAAGPA
jgi:DNA-binding NarL/FixJ family response regulator